jgi:1-aminocyclopropane-1-carboxylate deaminase
MVNMNILNHLNIPSPMTQVKTEWSEAAGIELWLKRDDLIHPIISGNKWRKLSGIFSHYNSIEYSQVVTFGGAYSNHLLATAASCAIMKVPCTGIIRGEEPKELNPVLKMCRLYGMQLQFVSREEYKSINRQRGIIEASLFIPEGGACELGTVGCAEIISELNLTDVSKLFVACGTGTTIAGLASKIINLNLKTTLIGIQVLKGASYISDEIKEIYGINNATILDEFHCGGYAKTNEELISFIKEFTVETGVLLDPVYTGKMMFAIKKLTKSNKIISGEKIVAIHTGGLTGWFGKADEL